jgi:hypothetical protein
LQRLQTEAFEVSYPWGLVCRKMFDWRSVSPSDI